MSSDASLAIAEEATVTAALAALERGQDPLVFTARGPDDTSVPALFEAVARCSLSIGEANKRIGSALAPTIPGAAIFRTHCDNAHDGLELALKGGQMGSADYFGWVRDGGGARNVTQEPAHVQ